MPIPRRQLLAPVPAILAALLLLPAGASARRAEAGERHHNRAASATPGEGPAPPESPPAGETEVPLPSAPGAGLQSAPPRGCVATVESSATHILAGEAVTIGGTLSCRNGSSAGVAVAVLEHGRGELKELGTVLTAADGSYELTTTALSRNCMLVVRPLGGHGGHVAVKVAPHVTLAEPASGAQLAARKGRTSGTPNRLVFSGVVDPASEGTRVALQREDGASGERWRTFAYGSVGEEGHFTIVHGLRSVGGVSVRAVAHVTGEAPAVSEAVTIEVAQSQNPELTIIPSADPISAGQALTITGVAAAGANQPVTLLARTAGKSFAPIAEGVTGAGGEYSFTPTPTQNTAYRVSDATAQSSILAEGFSYLLSVGPAPATLRAGKPLAFTGTVTPAPAGTPVFLERETPAGIRFKLIAVGSVDAESAFSIPYAFHSSSTAILRIRVPAGPGVDGTTSASFNMAVSGAAGGE